MVHLITRKIEGIWFGVAFDDRKFFSTSFAPKRKKAVHDLLKNISFSIDFQYSPESSPFAEKVINYLKDVYDGGGGLCHFSLVKSHLSSYAQKVIDVVSLIPVGWVTTYSSVAEVAGGGPRSIGRVMSLNPFPLLVPCHRVVRSDLSPGGYLNGVEVKLEILKRECKGFHDQQEFTMDGSRLLVYPVEKVLKSKGE